MQCDASVNGQIRARAVFRMIVKGADAGGKHKILASADLAYVPGVAASWRLPCAIFVATWTLACCPSFRNPGQTRRDTPVLWFAGLRLQHSTLPARDQNRCWSVRSGLVVPLPALPPPRHGVVADLVLSYPFG